MMMEDKSIKALELGTQMWQDDWHPTETVRVQVSTWCECRCLPGVSAGTYPVWVQVPTRCECRYLPGVSAGTCTYLVWVQLPTGCECRYLYLPGESAGTYPVWVQVPTRSDPCCIWPVRWRCGYCRTALTGCTQQTVNPIIHKATCTQQTVNPIKHKSNMYTRNS